jgi:predicted RNA-binding protein
VEKIKMRFWIGVASKEHVQRGVDGGFCQLCHGRASPLKRMSAGDWIIYYSSKEKFNEPVSCQQFTAVGKVIGEDVYQFEMAPGFVPHRRDVNFLPAKAVAIRPLIERLSFIANKTRWGSVFRFGHLEIPRADFELIAMQMLGFDPSVRTRANTMATFKSTSQGARI